jgi:hypothetical protein
VEQLANGDLLDAAEDAGFDVLLRSDQNIRYQQNLVGRKIAIVLFSKARWRLIKLVVAQIVTAVDAAQPGTVTRWLRFHHDSFSSLFLCLFCLLVFARPSVASFRDRVSVRNNNHFAAQWLAYVYPL